MTPNQAISIVIPTHKSDATLLKLIQSIFRFPPPVPYETIVVANPPSVATKQLVSSFLNTVYLENNAIGVNLARNKGLAQAKYDIVLFLDDDCEIIDQNFFSNHLALHEKFPNFVGIGGPYSLLNRSNCIASTYYKIQTDWLQNGKLPGFQSDLLLGGNISFKKTQVLTVKFDEQIIFGGAETELIFRLASLGLFCKFDSGLLVGHNCDISFFTLMKKAFKQGRSAKRLALKEYYGLTVTRKFPAQSSFTSVERVVKYFFDSVFSFSYNSKLPLSAVVILFPIMAMKHVYHKTNETILVKLWAAIGGLSKT